MGIRGINHLAFVTPDMEATCRFYQEVLGLDLVATVGHGDPNEPYPHRHYFFRLSDHETIAFFEWPGVDTGENKPAGIPGEGREFDHLSFNVDTAEDLVALRERLVAHDHHVSDIVDHTILWSIYFDDPVNGMALEATVWVRNPVAVPYFGDPDPTPTAARVQKEREVPTQKPELPPEFAAI
jgi:catechol 2,3-dioxygenase-like lactoylglutathione lyase family enzyme